MKRILLLGMVTVVVVSLVAGFVVPALAHEPEAGEAAPANEDVWEAMHETCEYGDWESMEAAAEGMHGEDFSDMPCHGGSYDGSQAPTGLSGGMGGHMGGGMMGGGWGGMTGGMY